MEVLNPKQKGLHTQSPALIDAPRAIVSSLCFVPFSLLNELDSLIMPDYLTSLILSYFFDHCSVPIG